MGLFTLYISCVFFLVTSVLNMNCEFATCYSTSLQYTRSKGWRWVGLGVGLGIRGGDR